MGRDLFCRARRVTVRIDGETLLCRGTVQRLKEDKTAVSEKTELFGGVKSGAYVYFGNAKALCGAENAALMADGVQYRVLYAQRKTGLCGEEYIRAVLEKEEEYDGDGA